MLDRLKIRTGQVTITEQLSSHMLGRRIVHACVGGFVAGSLGGLVSAQWPAGGHRNAKRRPFCFYTWGRAENVLDSSLWISFFFGNESKLNKLMPKIIPKGTSN